MTDDLIMPFLSETMEEGTVVKWLKEPGDFVSVGDEVVELETDKLTMVYESDVEGYLIEVVAAEGDTVPCGEVIALIGPRRETPG